MDARRITQALGGKWYGRYGAATCPVHDDREPSLVLRDGDSTLLVRCYAGCDPSDVLEALRSRGLIEGRGQTPAADWQQRRREAAEAKAESGRDREARIKRALQIWRAARPAVGTRVEKYLAGRGLMMPSPASIRFAPSLWHGPSRQEWPAMIAAVQAPDGAIRGVHRTYLAKDGAAKAPISPAKMMLGDCMAGAVRFANAGAELAIAEGIETALSFQQMTGVATWAALFNQWRQIGGPAAAAPCADGLLDCRCRSGG